MPVLGVLRIPFTRSCADSNCKTPKQPRQPLLGCSIHRGERVSSIHGGVRESIAGIGSPSSASWASGRQPGRDASFRMRVSIRKPLPALLLERPSLGNFAEFAWIYWAVTSLTRYWRKAPVPYYTGAAHTAFKVQDWFIFSKGNRHKRLGMSATQMQCIWSFSNDHVLKVSSRSPPPPFSMHQTCCSYLECKRAVYFSRIICLLPANLRHAKDRTLLSLS